MGGELLRASSAGPPGLPSTECLQHVRGCSGNCQVPSLPASLRHTGESRGRKESTVYLYRLGCYGSRWLGTCPEEGGPDWGDPGGK